MIFIDSSLSLHVYMPHVRGSGAAVRSQALSILPSVIGQTTKFLKKNCSAVRFDD